MYKHNKTLVITYSVMQVFAIALPSALWNDQGSDQEN